MACFTYELHDVLFAFCKDKIIALGARKKAELLEERQSKYALVYCQICTSVLTL